LNSATTGRLISVRDNPNSTTDVARISGVISNSAGAGAVIFGGNGVLELTAANTYTGPTAIQDGTLQNNVVKLVGTGSIANSSQIVIGSGRTFDVTGLTGGANYSASASRFALASGQSLSGTGTVNGSTLVGPNASLRGGSPPDVLNAPTGQLTIAGSLRLAGGGELAVDLNGTSSSGALVSRVAVTGTGSMWDFDTTGGPVTIRLLNDQNLMVGQTYSFILGSSSGGFTLNGSSVTEFTKGIDYVLSSNFVVFGDSSLFVSGTNLALQFSVSAVPEPGAILLIAATGLGLFRRFRRSTVAVG
jgi:autotransporter-associated beta strand protein